MPRTDVIDLSHHNVIPSSLIPAKQNGVRGIIHKCTEGTGFVDDKCKARYYLAQKAAMLWGIYHFLRPGDMQRQANFFYDTAMDLGVLDESTLLVADFEVDGISLDDLLAF